MLNAKNLDCPIQVELMQDIDYMGVEDHPILEVMQELLPNQLHPDSFRNCYKCSTQKNSLVECLKIPSGGEISMHPLR